MVPLLVVGAMPHARLPAPARHWATLRNLVLSPALVAALLAILSAATGVYLIATAFLPNPAPPPRWRWGLVAALIAVVGVVALAG
ncbi:MAG: hypothetical protein K2W96_07585 [Gemmataceae bacterium]|nr:hypothetical protein [Gemmataceae bacterium]